MAGRLAHSLLFFGMICLLPVRAQLPVRDSLQRLYLTAHDTLKVQLLGKLSRVLEANKPDSAVILGDSALVMATRIGYENGKGLAYTSIGSSQTTAGRYDLGIQNLLSAMKIFETLNNRRAITNVCNSIANAYLGLQDNEKAYTYYLKSYNMASGAPRNDFMVAVSSVGLGGILLEKGSFNEAVDYFKKAEEYFEKTQNYNYGAMATSMIGEAYFKAGNYSAAEKYYRRVIITFRKINDEYGLATCLHSLGVLEMKRKNYAQASTFLTEALEINLRRKAWDNIQNTAMKLSESMELQDKPAKALEYYKIYMQYKDSVINVQRNKAVADATSKYDTEKKEQELKMKNMELEASQMQVSLRSRLLFVFAGAVLVALILLFFVFKQYNEKKNANLMLIYKNGEIEKQKFIIEEKNKDITDSINYARHIQQAIITPPGKMKEVFSDLFVIFKPKDIVSGDFYMFENTATCAYLAVVDCTGHGVPGAMLSVFAHASLKNIISAGNFETDPAGILSEMCQHFKNNLHAGDLSINDGADVAICIVHNAAQKLYFAGARHDLHLVRNGQLLEYASDRYGISGANSGKQMQYTNYEVVLQKQDKLYIFTDGFADQFGGPNGKKFKRRQLENKVLALSNRPFTEQAQLLEVEFERWKGNLEQLDDVTIIGFEVLT